MFGLPFKTLDYTVWDATCTKPVCIKDHEKSREREIKRKDSNLEHGTFQ